MPDPIPTFLSDQLAARELGLSSRVLETLHPDAAALTAVALAGRVQRLAVVVPAKGMEAYCRALGERLPASTVSAVRWGDGPFEAGPLVVIDERVFFDGLAAEPLASILPDFDHWLLAQGDGLPDRLRRALRTTVRDPRICGALQARLGLGAVPGSTTRVPPEVLRDRSLIAVPRPLREDPNRVFTLELTRQGRALCSTVVDVAPVLEGFLERSTVTVLGRALSVDGDLGFAMQELGLDAEGAVDPNAVRDDLLLFVPPMPRATERAWPAQVIEASRRAASVPAEVTVLASAWNRAGIGRVLERGLATGSTRMGHPAQADGAGSDVVVLDRLPVTPRPEDAPDGGSTRTFVERVLPRSLQRFRFLASQIARTGVMVVLDGRMRSRWADGFWRAVPGEHTDDWDVYRRWVREHRGGVR